MTPGKRMVSIYLMATCMGALLITNGLGIISCATGRRSQPPIVEELADPNTVKHPPPNCADPMVHDLALKFVDVVYYVLFDPTCGVGCEKHLSRLERINYNATACASVMANDMRAIELAGKP